MNRTLSNRMCKSFVIFVCEGFITQYVYMQSEQNLIIMLLRLRLYDIEFLKVGLKHLKRAIGDCFFFHVKTLISPDYSRHSTHAPQSPYWPENQSA